MIFIVKDLFFERRHAPLDKVSRRSLAALVFARLRGLSAERRHRTIHPEDGAQS